MNKDIKIGQIVNTHSLKGNIKVNMYTETLEDIKKYSYIFISLKNMDEDKEKIKFEIEEIKFLKNQVILKLKGIEDISEAEKLKNKYIYITEEQLKKNNPLKNNEYYIKDLVGLDVINEKGEKVGILSEVLELNTDVYVVKRSFGKDILIPAIKQFVKKVNIEENKMLVSLGGLDEI